MTTLLTTKEVSRRLQVSRATVGRLIGAGILPAVILARRPRRCLVRVREDVLEAYIQSPSARAS